MNIKSENLLNEIEKRKEDLIDLTQKLIRIPTLNPPGNNYLEICEFLKQRMEKNGFETKLIRAYDTPGDSNKFPRWNLVCFKDGVNKGNTIHFNGLIFASESFSPVFDKIIIFYLSDVEHH